MTSGTRERQPRPTETSDARSRSDAREPGIPVARAEGWRRFVPTVCNVILWIVAGLCALAAVGRSFRDEILPVRHAVDMVLVPAPANLAYAVFLAMLAAAAVRRKYVAWWIMTAHFAVSALLGALFALVVLFTPSSELVDDAGDPLFNTYDSVLLWIGAGVSLTALVILWLARKEFSAKARRGSFWRGFGVLVVLLVVGSAVGYGLILAFPGTLTGAGDKLAYTVEHVLGGAVSFDIKRTGDAPGWINLFLGLFGAIALLAAFGTLMRTQNRSSTMAPEDERRVRTLLAKFGGRDSLGYFATRRDKAVIFSPTGRSAVSYRVVNGVSLASADPVGDPGSWDAAIDAWLRQAREYAWAPAVIGASEEGANAYARAGLKALHLGDEAILRISDFTVDGPDMRPVRQAVNRITRAGHTARVRRHSEIPDTEMTHIADLVTTWRDTENERGFSMALGRLGDPADGRCVLVEAVGPDGAVTAMLSLSPWGTRGLSLDLMRRDPHAENGVMEFMVTSLMQAAPRLSIDQVSLNFAMFREVFEEGARIGAGPVLRLWRHTLLFFSQWWQLESLYRSNAKYHPHWTRRFLCFGEGRELARVALASAVAEGYLPILGTSSVPPLGRQPTDGATPALIADVVEEEPEPAGPASARLPEQMRVRVERAGAIRDRGIDPYPVGYPRTHTCGEVHELGAGAAPDVRLGEVVAVAGRVMLNRDHGGLLFATVRDWSGDLQVMLDHGIHDWTSTVDVGDHVGATGELITTRTGELTIHITSWQLTAKCLRPLPHKRHGVTDPEARVRQRHLDIITSDKARELLRVRSTAVHSLRDSLVRRRFLEVETPILQRIHGGANARPFTTHINAYNLKLHLRIAPELYLKRLVVGGVEQVFELGRTFRNEGADYSHNPEFSMLEAYQAYGDYTTMLRLTRELVQEAATAAYGTATARRPGTDEPIDLSGEWRTMTVNEAISHALGEEVTADTPRERLIDLCRRAQVPYDPTWNRGAVLLEMYEHLVESKTVEPTFYKDFPTEVSPLTRQHRDDPRLAERWDLVAFGVELGTAYSELIDPQEQRRRFIEQSMLAAGGDPEAMEIDEDFLEALEYAMPPTGGLGIGVDRLVMLLTGRSIRETLPFPLVRASS